MRAGGEIERGDSRVVDAGPSHPHSEERRLASGQHLRPPVAEFAVRGVYSGYHSWLAAAFGRYRLQRSIPAGREDDRIADAPSSAGCEFRRVGNRERVAARQADLPDRPVDVEASPLAVGGQKQVAPTLRPGQRTSLRVPQPTDVQTVSLIDNRVAAAGDGDRVRRHTVWQRDGEADRTGSPAPAWT